MNGEEWLHALAVELRRHGVPPDRIQPVVAEVASHLRDSGERPEHTFGSPASYAAAVAASIGTGGHPTPHRQPGPVRLAACGITKRYGRSTVLSSVDLTVRAGQIVAVVGANGCGKSTLLRICAGLVSPDAGTVQVNGTLGYCPQQGGTADFLLPDEHFVLVGAGRDLDRDRSRRVGRAAARQLDWDASADTPVRHLSGGTRQKLNLAMSLMTEPDVLLLDEPYQGFDRGTYVNFWDRLWQLRDAGRAVVVVTHLLTQLDQVDAVLDLSASVAVAEGSRA